MQQLNNQIYNRHVYVYTVYTHALVRRRVTGLVKAACFLERQMQGPPRSYGARGARKGLEAIRNHAGVIRNHDLTLVSWRRDWRLVDGQRGGSFARPPGFPQEAPALEVALRLLATGAFGRAPRGVAWASSHIRDEFLVRVRTIELGVQGYLSLEFGREGRFRQFKLAVSGGLSAQGSVRVLAAQETEPGNRFWFRLRFRFFGLLRTLGRLFPQFSNRILLTK